MKWICHTIKCSLCKSFKLQNISLALLLLNQVPWEKSVTRILPLSSCWRLVGRTFLDIFQPQSIIFARSYFYIVSRNKHIFFCTSDAAGLGWRQASPQHTAATTMFQKGKLCATHFFVQFCHWPESSKSKFCCIRLQSLLDTCVDSLVFLCHSWYF